MSGKKKSNLYESPSNATKFSEFGNNNEMNSKNRVTQAFQTKSLHSIKANFNKK